MCAFLFSIIIVISLPSLFLQTLDIPHLSVYFPLLNTSALTHSGFNDPSLSIIGIYALPFPVLLILIMCNYHFRLLLFQSLYFVCHTSLYKGLLPFVSISFLFSKNHL